MPRVVRRTDTGNSSNAFRQPYVEDEDEDIDENGQSPVVSVTPSLRSWSSQDGTSAPDNASGGATAGGSPKPESSNQLVLSQNIERSDDTAPPLIRRDSNEEFEDSRWQRRLSPIERYRERSASPPLPYWEQSRPININDRYYSPPYDRRPGRTPSPRYGRRPIIIDNPRYYENDYVSSDDDGEYAREYIRDRRIRDDLRAPRRQPSPDAKGIEDLQTINEGGNPPNQPLLKGMVDLKNLPEIARRQDVDKSATETRMAWKAPQTSLTAYSAVAELSTIHSAEYYTDEMGQHKLTLHCPDGPQAATNQSSSLVTMRWMHIAGIPSTLRVLEDLVTECPFISQPLQSVALSLLLEVSKKCRQTPDEASDVIPGTVFRYIGRYSTDQGRYEDDPEYDTEPVTFLSSPFLSLSHDKPGPSTPGNLLEFHYGYDLPGTGNRALDAHSMTFSKESRPRTLRVPSLWSLVIGSTLLITFGDVTLREIMAHQVTIDTKPMGSSSGVFTVRIVEESQLCQHHIVIDRDCNYVSFLKHISSLSKVWEQGEAEKAYVLIFEDGSEVMPRKWVELIASGKVEEHIFGARKRSRLGRTLPLKFSSLLHGASASSTLETTPGSPGTRRINYLIPEKHLYPRSRVPPPRNIRPPVTRRRESSRWSDYELQGREKSQSQDQTRDPGSVRPPGQDRILPRSKSLRGESGGPTQALVRYRGYPESPNVAKPVLPDGYSRLPLVHRPSGGMGVPELYQLHQPSDRDISHEEKEVRVEYLPVVKRDLTSTAYLHDPLNLFNSSESDSEEEPALQSLEKVIPRSSRSREPDLENIESARTTVEEEPSIAPDISPVPFLTWRLSWEHDDRTPAGISHSLIQLLDKISANLGSGSLGRHYQGIVQCTEDDFRSRLNVVTEFQAMPLRTANTARTGSNADINAADNKTASLNDYRTPLRSATTAEEHSSARSQLLSAVLDLVLERSVQILAAWLPRDSSASIHPVCTRFWGAMDMIFRQVHWLKCLSWQRAGAPFIVTGELMPPQLGLSPSGIEVRKHPSQCEDCIGKRQYSSLEEALEHLHSHHVSSACTKSLLKPYGDPCIGWVRPFNSGSETFSMPDCDPFIDLMLAFSVTLSDILEKIETIHLSVSGVAKPLEGTNMRPHLLSRLVHAFEKIMDRFVFQARALLWFNRNGARLSTRIISGHVSELLVRARRLDDEIIEHLHLARRDLFILGTTKRDASRLVKAYVGPEFLLLSLLHNMQSGFDDAFIKDHARKIDVGRHYERLTNSLHFKILRDPRRERFLEIQTLRDNLEALDRLKCVQGNLIVGLGKILRPDSFSFATTEWKLQEARGSLTRFERPYVSAQSDDLLNALERLDNLRRRVEVLQVNAKISLEILEEGHGKAIRVFTIVTLFFLPLSFLTSFFGMNTTDIRDMPHGQSVFWMAAVPLTSIIITTALLYGYKWDEVTRLASRWFRSRSSKLATSFIALEDSTPLLGEHRMNDRNNTFGTMGSADVKKGSRYLFAGFGGAVRQRAKKAGGGLPRRQTRDSFF